MAFFGEVGPSICSDDFVFQQKLKMLDPAEGVPPAAKLRKQLRFRANWNCGFIQEICFRRGLLSFEPFSSFCLGTTLTRISVRRLQAARSKALTDLTVSTTLPRLRPVST